MSEAEAGINNRGPAVRNGARLCCISFLYFSVVSVFSIVQISPFRPRTSRCATTSPVFWVPTNIFTWSALGPEWGAKFFSPYRDPEPPLGGLVGKYSSWTCLLQYNISLLSVCWHPFCFEMTASSDVWKKHGQDTGHMYKSVYQDQFMYGNWTPLAPKNLAARDQPVVCHTLTAARGRNHKHVYYFRAIAAGIWPQSSI